MENERTGFLTNYVVKSIMYRYCHEGRETGRKVWDQMMDYDTLAFLCRRCFQPGNVERSCTLELQNPKHPPKQKKKYGTKYEEGFITPQINTSNIGSMVKVVFEENQFKDRVGFTEKKQKEFTNPANPLPAPEIAVNDEMAIPDESNDEFIPCNLNPQPAMELTPLLVEVESNKPQNVSPCSMGRNKDSSKQNSRVSGDVA